MRERYLRVYPSYVGHVANSVRRKATRKRRNGVNRIRWTIKMVCGDFQSQATVR